MYYVLCIFFFHRLVLIRGINGAAAATACEWMDLFRGGYVVIRRLRGEASITIQLIGLWQKEPIGFAFELCFLRFAHPEFWVMYVVGVHTYIHGGRTSLPPALLEWGDLICSFMPSA